VKKDVMQTYREEISVKGKPTWVDAVKIDSHVILLEGKVLRTARLRDEWYEDVEDPERIISALRTMNAGVDLVTMMQRLPETTPRFGYYMEYDPIAAVPISNYDHWFKTQIDTNARRAIRNAEKKGVVVCSTEYDDAFVKGMTEIYNESPVRQGKRFWHYGKDAETIRTQFSKYLFREEMIGAFYRDELIGLIMLCHAGRYAELGQIISKIAHRDKGVNNALIAKAIEICGQKKIPFLTYGYWKEGGAGDFQRRNGFQKYDVPRYFIPLSWRGELAIRRNLHRGVSAALPPALKSRLIALRSRWNARISGGPTTSAPDSGNGTTTAGKLQTER
jgi:hypothetical protein